MKDQVNPLWQEFTRDIVRSKEFLKLYNQVIRLYAEHGDNMLPDKSVLWRPMGIGSPDDVKVIIVGQDPYPQKGIADGLAFSTQSLIRPQSLTNVLSELKYNLFPDINFDFHWNDLSQWSRQGVLLLNANMTVMRDVPLSHSTIGWEHFIIPLLEKFHDKIFVLWGGQAKKLEPHCDGVVLKGNHPAARDQAFKGCEHFKILDKLLKERNIIIDWVLSDTLCPQMMIEGFNPEGGIISLKFSKAYMHYEALKDLEQFNGMQVKDLKMDELAARLQKKTINPMFRYLNPKHLAGQFRYYNELFDQNSYLKITEWQH